jgi:hypothetical protein
MISHFTFAQGLFILSHKLAYFSLDVLGVPLGFEFILYKHGPFSFDLSDEITAMRADALLQYQPRQPYGPSLFPNGRKPGIS